ncbi:MAG: D-alanyl-D-alanine carboxypeptidase [Spirochaetaceae bacterium]|nr:D-alanyl-D-alanine carboxypeptidase [Spirochaetaceae bacterium]
MYHLKNYRSVLLLFLALACIGAGAQTRDGTFQKTLDIFSAAGAAIPAPPQVNARAAILIDASTGTVLYEKNADLALPPASLAKLVLLHIAQNEIAAGRLSPDEIVEIDARDCSPSIPYGSSLMYLRPGMKVSIRDLMLGAAVVSGNDAAYALARRMAGSNDAFAALMNEAMLDMGLDRCTFVEPSGLSEKNLVTARQFARFCSEYIRQHPEALDSLHSVKSIRFPRPEHAVPGYVPAGDIVQYNRNPLIFSYEGADGLKTGYIIEVGFNIAATAMRNGSRFLVVLLGGTGPSYAGGNAIRTRDTKALLDWAFGNFVTVYTEHLQPKPVRVWGGKITRVQAVPRGQLAATVPIALRDAVTARTVMVKSLKAPVQEGQPIGKVVYEVAGKEIASVDLYAQTTIPRGGFFRRLIDGILRFFAYILGQA